ncbi:hypothetical protein EHW61_16400 [Salinivibrio sp. VYel6]|uniref:hypothetical protein n=1 Tax=Salinivibrio sp. VYel6 TaxID=2490493 RepID=UPI00128CF89D|nr:hypothetical protein [Salinivibrio sp. VYel6]MPX98209.1 hypothetical protein [Salinivibrio sp. VYel6]
METTTIGQETEQALSDADQAALEASQGAQIEDAQGQPVDTSITQDTGEKTHEQLEAEKADLQAQLDRALRGDTEQPEEEQADEQEVEGAENENEESPEVAELRERLQEYEQREVESAVFNIAGGEQQYKEMIEWAGTGLPAEEVEMYNAVMDTGTKEQKIFAARALQAIYASEVGVEGERLGAAKRTATESSAFQSDDELYAAMANPLYSEDSPAGEAYRQKVQTRMANMPISQTMDGWVRA